MFTVQDVQLQQQANQEAKFGRVVTFDGIRPVRDTGFRMAPQPPSEPYVRKDYPTDPYLFVDVIHADDMKDVGPGLLNGQPLNAVRLYEIDYAAVEARQNADITQNISARKKREEKENDDASKN